MDDMILIVIQKVYENRKAVIARVAEMNQNMKSRYLFYDTELSGPKYFMISITLQVTPAMPRWNEVCELSLHPGIVVGRNGNLHTSHVQLLHKFR
jgi:hypothetical protein